MFKKYENIVFYYGRHFRHPLTFGDKIFIIWHNIKGFFTRWKIVDTRKYTIRSYEDIKLRQTFFMSEKETADAKEIYDKEGTLEYTFYPMGIGWGIRVKSIKTGTMHDITDLDAI